MAFLAPDGPVYQAGTLSGNPLAMAAGLAQLREMERLDGWAVLEALGARLEGYVRDAMLGASHPAVFHRIGSMFCLFFGATEVFDLASALRSNRSAFSAFFHACLAGGVYLAPSPFETGFISVAHREEDIDATGEIIRRALRSSGS